MLTVRPEDAATIGLDWIEAASRRPKATLCLTSALAYHDLIDTIPATLDVAIPRGQRTPATTAAITWHHFDRATFDLGRYEIDIPGTDQKIGVYSAERSIADAFRVPIGYEICLAQRLPDQPGSGPGCAPCTPIHPGERMGASITSPSTAKRAGPPPVAPRATVPP